MDCKDRAEEHNDYLRQAKENARNRAVNPKKICYAQDFFMDLAKLESKKQSKKKFDFRIKNEGAKNNTEIIRTLSTTMYKGLAKDSGDKHITKLKNDIAVFRVEKEYFRRMFSGEYVDRDEIGAIDFMRAACKYCSHQRWYHRYGRCPDRKVVRTRRHPPIWPETLNHLFVYNPTVTALVIETLKLEGFDIKEKY